MGSGGLWFQGFNRRTSGQCLEMSIYFSNFGTSWPDFQMLILCCQCGCGWTPLPSLFSSLMDNGVQTPAGSLQLPQAALQELALSLNSRTLTQHQACPGPAATSEDRKDHLSQTGASQQCRSWLFVGFNLPC